MKKFLLSLMLLVSSLSAETKQTPLVLVKAFTVNEDSVKVSKTYPATIKSQRNVDIIARVSGILEKRYFTEGTYVKKGQILYEIEQETYQANVDAAKAALDQAYALLDKSTRDWDRYKKLYDNDSVSASTKDQYLYNYQNAKANVKSCEASLKNAKIQYSYTKIYAPIDGIIATTKLNEGNFINSNTSLTTITKINPVYVEFSMPQVDIEKYLKQIKTKNIKFAINCQNKCIRNGKLNYISPTLDSGTDTLLIRTEFKNTNNEVIVGQFTNINIENIKIPNVISIPEEAIMQTGTQSVVYVIDEKSTVQIRPITLTGNTSESGILIKGGLEKGEKIIISNIAKVRPNTKVQIMEGKK